MNYRHIFHAGNFADVLKHAVLARILSYLARKEAPFRVIDTHAGTGLYDLTSEAAQRSPEWKDGIARLIGTSLPPAVEALLAPYLAVVRPLFLADKPKYPGSPLIAQALTRTQDRLSFIEKHPIDHDRLKAALAGDRRAKVIDIDGWMAWKAQVPPPERRGLTLVDPPFEEPGEFERLVAGLTEAHRRWPGGTTLMWYPLKDGNGADVCADALAASGIPRILQAELRIEQAVDNSPLAATGLFIVNPPYTLDADLQVLLPFLARRLARGPGAGSRLSWLSGE